MATYGIHATDRRLKKDQTTTVWIRRYYDSSPSSFKPHDRVPSWRGEGHYSSRSSADDGQVWHDSDTWKRSKERCISE